MVFNNHWTARAIFTVFENKGVKTHGKVTGFTQAIMYKMSVLLWFLSPPVITESWLYPVSCTSYVNLTLDYVPMDNSDNW
jgi:hypothetical protein